MKCWGWIAVSVLAWGCSESPPSEQVDPTRGESTALILPNDPVALASLLATSPDSLQSAGLERYRSQSFDSARAIWKVELARTLAAHDQKGEARTRMWLGIVAWKLSDYKEGRAEGEASVKLKRALGMDDELSRSFNSLGLIAWHQGRYSDALTNFDSAIASAKRHHDSTGVARAYANVPLIKVELGRFDEARSDFVRALDANRIAGDSRTQGNILANQGMLEIRLGNPTTAVEYLNKARLQYTENEITEQANVLGQLATAWMALGDLQRGIAAADSAIKLARSENLQQELASNLEVLAELEMRAGDHRLALSTLRAADSIDAQIGLRVERGMNKRRSAMILQNLGEIAPARRMSRDAVEEHRKIGALNELALDRLTLATILFQSGDKELAKAQADTAESEARSIRNPAVINEAILTSASLALQSGTPDAALKKLKTVPDDIAKSDWRVADLRSTALVRTKNYVDARIEARRAVQLVESERASLGLGPLRSGYLANRTKPFSNLVSIDLFLGDTADAFATAASLPGRTLAERLSGVDGDGRVASIARNEKLLVRAAELERLLSEARNEGHDEQAKTIGLELARTRTAYESGLAQSAAVPRAAMLGNSSVTLKGVQQRLGQKQGLVLYLSGEDRLDMFVVRADRVVHRSAPIGDKDLARRVRVARDALQRSSGSDALRMLADLNRLLIAPVETALSGATDLIVVPHASLAALPLAALWNRERGQFLVQERSVTYAPTVAAISLSSSSASLAPIAVFAPEAEKLPGSKVEALAITEADKQATSYIGRKATKKGVRLALQRGNIVHIAAHGLHNAQNPLFSRVTVEKSRDADSNGALAVHEIMGMSTRSPVVFLSGCETGVSTAGEGVFSTESEDASLSQAFLFAGASNVVATLWPIRDSEAARIASDFYRTLNGRASASQALAIAQRSAIRRRNGMTWAAYTVSSAGTANRN